MGMNDDEIKTRIRLRRKSLHLKQKDLAKKVGVSAVAVNAWETGKSKPLSNVVSLALALQVTTDWLLTGRWSLAQGGPPLMADTTDTKSRTRVRRIELAPQYLVPLDSEDVRSVAEHCVQYGSKRPRSRKG